MYTSNNLTPGKVDWENTSMTKTRKNSMNFYCTFVSLRKCDVLLSIAIDQPKKSSYHSRSQHLPQQFMPCLPLGRTYQVWNLACKHLKHVQFIVNNFPDTATTKTTFMQDEVDDNTSVCHGKTLHFPHCACIVHE